MTSSEQAFHVLMGKVFAMEFIVSKSTINANNYSVLIQNQIQHVWNTIITKVEVNGVVMETEVAVLRLVYNCHL